MGAADGLSSKGPSPLWSLPQSHMSACLSQLPKLTARTRGAGDAPMHTTPEQSAASHQSCWSSPGATARLEGPPRTPPEIFSHLRRPEI